MSPSLREPENLDFSLSPLPIPARFHHVRYNGARYPGAEGSWASTAAPIASSSPMS
jgi:hypothetical protein